MHLIVYASHSNIPPDKINGTVTFIEAIAKLNNPLHGITGILLYFKGHFLQAVEGEEAELRQLMENVIADPRHDGIVYLVDQKIERRGFDNWNMDFFNLDDDAKINFDTVRKLTADFKRNLLPRSDELMSYYKALLGLEEKYRDK